MSDLTLIERLDRYATILGQRIGVQNDLEASMAMDEAVNEIERLRVGGDSVQAEEPLRDHIPAHEFSDADLATNMARLVSRLNELSDEAGERGLQVELRLDPCVRVVIGDRQTGPYVQVTVSRVL